MQQLKVEIKANLYFPYYGMLLVMFTVLDLKADVSVSQGLLCYSTVGEYWYCLYILCVYRMCTCTYVMYQMYIGLHIVILSGTS